MPRIAVFALFFFSGVSGLIYEVVWTRLLTSILGNTIYAVSIVLSAFMAGLSIGSLAAGRFIDTRKDSLKIYAALELFIGIAGFGITVLLNQTGPVYVWVHHALADSGPAISAWRSLFAFLVLIVPTTLMGATLPVLSKFTSESDSKIGATVGMLYGLNTLGAAVGCWAAGFLFIGAIGIVKTVVIASALNIAIGIFAWSFRTACFSAQKIEQQAQPPEPLPQTPSQVSAVVALAAFAVSGFAAMGYEISWTRILITYMGNTVYAFAAMLTSFLLGLALGGLALSYFVNKLPKPFFCFGLLQLGIGIYIMALLYYCGSHLYLLVPHISPYPVVSNVFAMFLKAMALMLPPTILMGASFPLAARLYVTQRSAVGSGVSKLYSWNTIACITGSLVTGFVVVPNIGFEKSMIVMLSLNICCGVALLCTQPVVRIRLKAAVIICILGASAVGITFIPAHSIEKLHRTIFHNEEKTIRYKETPYGIVEVLQGPARRRLLQDDLDLAGTSLAYLSSQKPLGHLPMLLHPRPHSVFIIGFGAGGATYAASTYPDVQKIRIAELNKEIIAAAPLFFSVNHDVLSNPKCSVAITDGRQFLLTTPSRFDVISVDLLWPQSAGAGSLYTKEFYRLCFDRLNQGGLMVEWIHTGLIPKKYVLVILKTIRQVFPYAALWTSRSFGHIFLVASKDERFRIDYATFSKRIRSPLAAQDLAEIGLDAPSAFMSFFLADGKALDAMIGDSVSINTDNTPIIEYQLPLCKGWYWYDNAVGIMQHKKSVLSLLDTIDGVESKAIEAQERTLMMVLQSKLDFTRGDQWGAIMQCTDAFRANPANSEAAGWYDELKQTMKCLSDSGKAPPNILSAFDTSALQ